MFQKFFTNTIVSRFIKNLLSTESIPLLDYVSTGDSVVEGCLYLYKNLIIRCETTGTFNVDDNDILVPSDTLYPSSYCAPGTGYIPARYKVTGYFNDWTKDQLTYKYQSKNQWYDSETHKHLGNYLRMIKALHNIDLMPYYNCYSGKELTDIHLETYSPKVVYPDELLLPSESLYPGVRIDKTKASYSTEFSNEYRCIAVPIKFGKTYTIAVESPFPIQLRSIIYDEHGLTKKPQSSKYYADHEQLEDSYVTKLYSKFHEPFTYSVTTTDKQLYDRQRDLYLLIQLKSSITSSVVVLEGDYTDIGTIKTDQNNVRKHSLYKNHSLLSMNTRSSYAFSDRLVEYLLTNVITHKDDSSVNIEKIQRQLYKVDDIYRTLVDSHKVTLGVWDKHIASAVFRLIEQHEDHVYFRDHDGYINKDVELLLYNLVGEESVV